MRRIFAACTLGAAGLIACVGSAGAASAPTHGKTVNWGQHDTAVYVVSTLNLLHTKKGQSVPSMFQQRMGVSHFDVYADTAVSDLYFVQMKRDDGSIVAAFAYTMGWTKPKLVYSTTDKLGRAKPALKIVVSYKSDPKQLIGSFTSTLPS